MTAVSVRMVSSEVWGPGSRRENATGKFVARTIKPCLEKFVFGSQELQKDGNFPCVSTGLSLRDRETQGKTFESVKDALGRIPDFIKTPRVLRFRAVHPGVLAGDVRAPGDRGVALLVPGLGARARRAHRRLPAHLPPRHRSAAGRQAEGTLEAGESWRGGGGGPRPGVRNMVSIRAKFLFVEDVC